MADLNKLDGWHKSTYSNPDNCVEVAPVGAGAAVRDTKNGGAGPVLSFDSEAWAGFIRGVRAGEFS